MRRLVVLCSRCSASVTPVVAVDIDGTLGDYHGHFQEFAMGYLGFNRHTTIVPYLGECEYKEWFCSRFSVDLTTFREIKLAYRQGGMKRTMPVFPLASWFVSLLSASGIEVWLTTTRPYLRLDGVDRDTREWLARNRIDYDHLLYDEEKYSVLARNIDAARVVAVVDDDPEQLRKAERALHPGVGILRTMQHNRAAEWHGVQENGLDKIYELIAKRMEAWKAAA